MFYVEKYEINVNQNHKRNVFKPNYSGSQLTFASPITPVFLFYKDLIILCVYPHSLSTSFCFIVYSCISGKWSQKKFFSYSLIVNVFFFCNQAAHKNKQSLCKVRFFFLSELFLCYKPRKYFRIHLKTIIFFSY